MKENITKHIDKSVTVLFLVTLVTALLVLGYKYNTAIKCSDTVTIDYTGYTFEVGENIEFFSNNVDNSKNLKWDFGDASPEETGNNIHHKFRRSGDYTVYLNVDNSCSYAKTITIKPKRVIPPPPPIVKDTLPKHIVPVLNIPSRIKVGVTLKAKETNPKSNKWEWSFGDSYQRANSNNREAKHTYRKAGVYTISVKVNDEEKSVATKQIRVYNEASPCPLITEEQFTNMIGSFLDSKVQQTNFDSYLISNYSNNRIVAVNYLSNDKIKLDFKRMSISKFFKEISANKNKYRIKVLTLFKNSNNCVKQIEVNLTELIKTEPVQVVTPKPVVKKPKSKPKPKPVPKTKIKKLTISELTKLLEGIYSGENTPDSIDEFVCNKTKPIVLMNDGQEKMNIQKLAERLKRKRLRMKKLVVTDLYHNEETNCITKIKFNYRK